MDSGGQQATFLCYEWRMQVSSSANGNRSERREIGAMARRGFDPHPPLGSPAGRFHTVEEHENSSHCQFSLTKIWHRLAWSHRRSPRRRRRH